MSHFSIGNTYDQSLIWQLFHDFIQAAQELELDEALLTEVEEKFDMLNPSSNHSIWSNQGVV